MCSFLLYPILAITTGYSNEKLFFEWQLAKFFEHQSGASTYRTDICMYICLPSLPCLKTGAPIFWAASSIASALEFNFCCCLCLCFCFYSEFKNRYPTTTERRANEFLGVEMLLKFTRHTHKHTERETGMYTPRHIFRSACKCHNYKIY